MSPCGRYLASGSGDHGCYVWHTASPGSPVARLGPQEAEVTCVSWSRAPGSLLLAAASDDMRHRLWRDSRRLPEQGEVRGRAEMLDKLDPAPVFMSPVRRRAEANVRTPQSGRARCCTPSSQPRGGTPSMATFLTPNHALATVSETKSPLRTPVNEVKRGLKRRTVDFNDENCEPRPKTAKIADGRRDLSSSISSLLTSPSPRCSFSPSSYQSPSKRLSSPRKMASPLKLPLTPVRSNLSSAALLLSCLSSPTANLPNLAVDGRSPRTLPRAASSLARPAAKTRDWLTEMAARRRQEPAAKKTGAKKAVVKKTIKKV